MLHTLSEMFVIHRQCNRQSYPPTDHILGYILPEHAKNHNFVNYSITKYIKYNDQQKLPLKLSKFLDNIQDNFKPVSIIPSLI